MRELLKKWFSKGEPKILSIVEDVSDDEFTEKSFPDFMKEDPRKQIKPIILANQEEMRKYPFKESYSVTHLIAAGLVKVVLEEGEPEILLVGDSALLDMHYIEIDDKQTTLSILPIYNSSADVGIQHSVEITAIIRGAHFSQYTLKGAANVYGHNKDSVIISADEDSFINLEGSCDYAKIVGSGSAIIKLDGMEIEQADIIQRGVSTAIVYVNTRIKADVYEAASLTLYGDCPKNNITKHSEAAEIISSF